MEHAIHVSGGHFIKAVGPTSSRKIRKRAKGAVDLSDSDDEMGPIENSDDDEDENRGIDFDAGDTVGKALALVTQVSDGSLHLHSSDKTIYRFESHRKHAPFSGKSVNKSTPLD
jgi:hypothetical protein